MGQLILGTVLAGMLQILCLFRRVLESTVLGLCAEVVFFQSRFQMPSMVA